MLPKEVNLERMEIIYSQQSDSCEKGEPGQILTINSDDAGGGPFIYISTKRWAMDWDEVDNLIQIINDFKARFKGE